MSQSTDNHSLPDEKRDDEIEYYSLEMTTTLTRLGPTLVERCVQIGIIQKGPSTQAEGHYTEEDIARLRKVRRLISELGLNWAGVEVVMRLTDELERLRLELNRLRPGL